MEKTFLFFPFFAKHFLGVYLFKELTQYTIFSFPGKATWQICLCCGYFEVAGIGKLSNKLNQDQSLRYATFG